MLMISTERCPAGYRALVWVLAETGSISLVDVYEHEEAAVVVNAAQKNYPVQFVKCSEDNVDAQPAGNHFVIDAGNSELTLVELCELVRLYNEGVEI